MNLTSFNPDDSADFSPIMPGLALASVAYLALPVVSRHVNAAVKRMKTGLSFLGHQALEKLNRRFPVHTKKITDLTGKVLKVSGQVAYKGIICLNEVTDLHNMGGTKDPVPSIRRSQQRLSVHDQQFAECCDMISTQISLCYMQYASTISRKTSEKVSDYFEIEDDDSYLFSLVKYFFIENMGPGVGWLIDFHQDLIVQTIKANLLHLLANLADEAYADDHDFADQQGNPVGRLLAVIGHCLADYKDRLNQIDPSDPTQALAYSQVFQEMADELLSKFFPNGARDIQLFHHTLPVTLIKEEIWKKIKAKLPLLLKQLHEDTRPLSQKLGREWKPEFDQQGGGLEADQLVKLLSVLLQNAIQSGQLVRLVNAQAPALKHWLQTQHVNGAEDFSQLLIQYGREFFLTQDPMLHQMGGEIERYFMEQLVFNLSQFVPNDAQDPTNPLPLHLLNLWIQGQPFKMVRDALKGTPQSLQEASQSVSELLAPFGLGEKETFPLPLVIKERAWPPIQKFLQEGLPALLNKKLPEWHALSHQQQNQDELGEFPEDYLLFDHLEAWIKPFFEQRIQHLQNTDYSIAQKLAPFLPLSVTQQQALDEQWQSFLEDDQSLEILKEFGHECSKALVTQFMRDLYTSYTRACEQQDMQALFNEEGDPPVEKASSVMAWVWQELTTACELLAIEGMSDREVKALKQALTLKNKLAHLSDPALRKTNQRKFKKSWRILKPRFTELSQHVLSILNYDCSTNLPVPSMMQPPLDKFLRKKLPSLLFEQFGHLLLPFLKKDHMQNQLKLLPQGELMIEACQLFARDLVTHLPSLLEGLIDQLPNQLDKISPLTVTDRAKEDIVVNLKALMQTDDPIYHPMWKGIQSYVEGLLLKVAVKLSQMGQEDIDQVRELIQQAREEFSNVQKQNEGLVEDSEIVEDNEIVEDDEEVGEEEQVMDQQTLFVNLTDELFALLGIQMPQDLFGVPSALQGPVLKGIKQKIAQGLMGIYQLDYKIRHHVVQVNTVEAQLPTSDVARAILALTRDALNKTTGKFLQRIKGQMQGIEQIYPPLISWLRKQGQKDYQLAPLFQQAIEQNLPTPFLENLFNLLDTGKQPLSDWINPILTDHVIQALAPLLEKEKEGQAAFDQAFLIALISVLTNHFKHLNQASGQPGGLNFKNFVKVAGSELHAAVPVEGDEEAQRLQRQQHFYQGQVELVFRLIFPQGSKDLATILPTLKLTDTQLDSAWIAAKDIVASQLAKTLTGMFDKKTLVNLVGHFFEILIENLDKPIPIKPPKMKSSSLAKAKPEEITPEQLRLDRLVGECLIEGLKFMELPIKRLQQLPNWIKKLIGLKGIEHNTFAAIGQAMRKQFDGKLLAQTLQRTLAQVVKEKPATTSKNEGSKTKKDITAEELSKLEKRLAQKGLDYLFRLIKTRIQQTINDFRNPILKIAFKSAWTVASFVIERILFVALRLLKVDHLLANRLQRMIERGTKKTVSVFSQPKLHEDFVYQGTEAFERVLTAGAHTPV